MTFDGAHYILSNISNTAQRSSITLNDKTLENIKTDDYIGLLQQM